MPTVAFTYGTRLAKLLFDGAVLFGGWDEAGQPADAITTTAMRPIPFVEVVMADAWNGEAATSVIHPEQIRAFQATPAEAICGTYLADDGAGAHLGWGLFPLRRHPDGV